MLFYQVCESELFILQLNQRGQEVDRGLLIMTMMMMKVAISDKDGKDDIDSLYQLYFQMSEELTL